MDDIVMDTRSQVLFVVSAPSGAGKTSLCRRVLENVPNLAFSISHTTRNAREGERHGENYFFVSPEEFEGFVAQGRMAEWAEIYGNRYGTAKETVEQQARSGVDLLFDID
ncbi:MAG: guanylate kinase, partial [Deltaproteobacteria bacterium]|nr:guanylate kinase [Deltaproteobacteria bacterium]